MWRPLLLPDDRVGCNDVSIQTKASELKSLPPTGCSARSHARAERQLIEGSRILGRRNKYTPVIIALSVNGLAHALTLPISKVRNSVLSGELPCRQSGLYKRVLISDAEAWLRSWPAATQRKKKEVPDAE
jgi:hypothetical protein